MSPTRKERRVVRVLLVEDQGMFRKFLEKWVREQPGYVLAASLRSGEDALAQLDVVAPDVMLVDFNLPGIDGLEFVRAARQVRPHARALVLTSLVDPLALTRVRESGVEGYLEKDASPQELAEAVAAVTSGLRYYSARMGETLARESMKPQAIGKVLTRREQQILMHVLGGQTSREIGEKIGLSVRTVEYHRSNVMAKLGTNSLAEMMARARQGGLVSET